MKELVKKLQKKDPTSFNIKKGKKKEDFGLMHLMEGYDMDSSVVMDNPVLKEYFEKKKEEEKRENESVFQ